MVLVRIRPSPYGYSKVDKEDPEELIHRRARFLIYKVMQQADSITKPSSLRIRFRRLKVRLGRRLKKLRKSVLVGVYAARFGVYKRVISLLKNWSWLFLSNGAASASAAIPSALPPAPLLITPTSTAA